MTQSKSDISQLPLNFPTRPSFGRDDFLVANCNSEAVNLIDQWPDWPYFALCLYGAAGCGKTHLAHLFADRASRQNRVPSPIPFVYAAQLNLETVREHFLPTRCLIIEDLEGLQNQEALFHIYNMYRDEGGTLLLTAREAPARLKFALPDLQSRLNTIPTIEILTPDDELLSALIVKLFADRQIMPAPEVVSYMLGNMQRSFDYARRLVAEIDSISLARKRAVTIPLVKEALLALGAESRQLSLF